MCQFKKETIMKTQKVLFFFFLEFRNDDLFTFAVSGEIHAIESFDLIKFEPNYPLNETANANANLKNPKCSQPLKIWDMKHVSNKFWILFKVWDQITKSKRCKLLPRLQKKSFKFATIFSEHFMLLLFRNYWWFITMSIPRVPILV